MFKMISYLCLLSLSLQNHIKSQVFHDDDNPIVAKAVELARGDQDSSKWMSWDPKATKNGLKDGVPHPKHEGESHFLFFSILISIFFSEQKL